MRPFRPAAALLALAALVPAASGAQAAGSAAGAATSSATLASLTAAGHSAAVAKLTASAGTTSGTLAKVVLQPLVVDGADAVPAVTVEPSSSPYSVPSHATPGALSSILSLNSPALSVTATGGDAPASGVTTPSGLGSLSVLGMPIALKGGLNVGSTVTKTKADAAKTLTVEDVALPSLADILGMLGIDLAKLPAGVLDGLLDQLPVDLTSAEQTAKAALDAAVGAAQTTVTTAQGGVTAAQSAVDTAQTAVDGATTALADAQAAFGAELTEAGVPTALWSTFDDMTKQTLYAEAWQAEQDVNAAQTDLDEAKGDLADAQGALATAQALLTDALADLRGAIADLAGLVAGVLDATPLVSLASANVGTLARVDSAKTANVTGSVSGLKILDRDVLATVTGSSTLDLAAAASAVVDQVNGALASVTNTLSEVMADATGIVFPAPVVRVLDQATATGTDGEFGTADAAVSLLTVEIQPITLPSLFALDSVLGALPVNVTQIANGVLQATGFELAVGTLTEAARYRPASIKPGTSNPRPRPTGSLPATGAPFGLAILAAAAAGAATLTLRKARTAE